MVLGVPSSPTPAPSPLHLSSCPLAKLSPHHPRPPHPPHPPPPPPQTQPGAALPVSMDVGGRDGVQESGLGELVEWADDLWGNGILCVVEIYG